MTAANIPNEIVNLTPADAVPVNQNFQYVENFVNSEMINRDGSVAMTGPLTLAGTPTQPTQAAPKSYVDSFFPVGVIMPYAGEAAPSGNWMLCRGQTLATAAYPALFAICGYRYGGSGGNFNLPDLRARVPFGVDPAVAALDATGKTGGTTTVPLPQHTHPMPHVHSIAHNHSSFSTGNQSANHTHNFGATTSSQGLHNHDMSQLAIFQGGGGFAALVYPGAPGASTINGTGGAGTHQHTVNGTTAANNVSHSHTVDIPNYAGNSGSESTPNTSNAGVAGAEMRPPFQALNYVIRVA